MRIVSFDESPPSLDVGDAVLPPHPEMMLIDNSRVERAKMRLCMGQIIISCLLLKKCSLIGGPSTAWDGRCFRQLNDSKEVMRQGARRAKIVRALLGVSVPDFTFSSVSLREIGQS